MAIEWKKIAPWLVVIIVVGVVAIAGLLSVFVWRQGNAPTPVAETSAPEVTIHAPTPAQTFALGETIHIESETRDRRGIARVELVIKDEVIRIDENAQPEPETPFIVAQPWQPEETGSYSVRVRAINTANITGESTTLTIVITEAPPATETPAPTAPLDTPTPPQSDSSDTVPTATATQTEVPTATPAANPTSTAEPTPIPLPAATFQPTGFEPEGRFNSIWQLLGAGQGWLGYPTGELIEGRDYARQPFERGIMIWWDNPNDQNIIWVLEQPESGFQSGLAWREVEDTWRDDGEYSCQAARQNEGRGPIRGFGKVWCEQAQTELGKPIAGEAGSGGNAPYATVQLFQGGMMVYTPVSQEVFVLYKLRAGWQVFGY